MQLGADVNPIDGGQIGTSSFTVHQEAWQNGRLKCQGRTVVVHYDRNRRPLPSPGIRARLEEHLA